MDDLRGNFLLYRIQPSHAEAVTSTVDVPQHANHGYAVFDLVPAPLRSWRIL